MDTAGEKRCQTPGRRRSLKPYAPNAWRKPGPRWAPHSPAYDSLHQTITAVFQVPELFVVLHCIYQHTAPAISNVVLLRNIVQHTFQFHENEKLN